MNKKKRQCGLRRIEKLSKDKNNIFFAKFNFFFNKKDNPKKPRERENKSGVPLNPKVHIKGFKNTVKIKILISNLKELFL